MPPVPTIVVSLLCPGAFLAAITGVGLVPDIPELLDAKALMIGIVACKVAVGLETERRMSASKDELLEVAHGLRRGTASGCDGGGIAQGSKVVFYVKSCSRSRILSRTD